MVCSAAELVLPKGALTTMIPFIAGVLHIDIVDADSRPGDDFQIGRMVDQGRVDPGPAAGDDGVVGADNLVKFGHGETEFYIERDAGVLQ